MIFASWITKIQIPYHIECVSWPKDYFKAMKNFMRENGARNDQNWWQILYLYYKDIYLHIPLWNISDLNYLLFVSWLSCLNHPINFQNYLVQIDKVAQQRKPNTKHINNTILPIFRSKIILTGGGIVVTMVACHLHDSSGMCSILHP